MHLSDHDIKQLNEDKLRELSAGSLCGLSIKLLADLKEARDRLNRTPQNSSQPPSSQAPWDKPATTKQEQETSLPLVNPPTDAAVAEKPQDEAKVDKNGNAAKRDALPKRPGRQLGAPGHSRVQQLPIDVERIHRPEHCAVCGQLLDKSAEQQAYTARYEIDVIPPSGETRGLVVLNTKHTYLEVRCNCGHWTRAQPSRAATEDGWTVDLTEWHLVGPMLVTLICALALRMRLSRARIQELLHDWLGLDLSTATINQCIHEAGRAVEPVVEQEILNIVREAEVLNADETSWFEGNQLLWLWVFTCATAVLFVVGKRTRELVVRILTADFENWLMSDGYGAYRGFDHRLRCLAHIIRKARGLAESLDQSAQGLGNMALDLIGNIFESIYQARAAPPDIPLREQYAQRLGSCNRLAPYAITGRHGTAKPLRRWLTTSAI